MKVVLVDEKDNEIGTEDKLAAHKEGELHRAFSIFVFNSKKELLLQKRSSEKYHSSELWSNTCCGHPGKGKDINNEARNRLNEEMGFDCHLEEKLSIIYKVKLENGLTEHEYDHVFFSKYDNNPKPNPNEVLEWKWMSLKELKLDIESNPSKYTAWLRIIIDRL